MRVGVQYHIDIKLNVDGAFLFLFLLYCTPGCRWISFVASMYCDFSIVDEIVYDTYDIISNSTK